MKLEYRLIVKKDPSAKFEILEFNESRSELEGKANILLEQNPTWEVRVVRETYNVS